MPVNVKRYVSLMCNNKNEAKMKLHVPDRTGKFIGINIQGG